MLISVIGWWNFRRENSRAYETVATLKKVEKLLGLHEEINEEDRFFKKDKYVLPNDFVEIDKKEKPEDTEHFVDWMLKRKAKRKYGNFHSTFTWLFRIYFIIALILVMLLGLIMYAYV